MMIRLMEKVTTLTWGPGLSSDPRSEAIAAPTAVAALAVAAAVVAAAAKVIVVVPPPTVVVAVAAAGAPGGDHPRMVVVAAGSRTDAPLRIVGLGASLLGPICSLQALLDGL
jgi:hypothetical protein